MLFVILVGIAYDNTPFALKGCMGDVSRWNAYFRKHHPSCSITVMSDKTPTTDATYPSRTNVILLLYKTVLRMKPTDMLFVNFSGHGLSTHGEKHATAMNGTSIPAEASECLLFRNQKGKQQNHITGKNTICENSIFDVLKNLQAETKAMICVDACASGDMFDLLFNMQTGRTPGEEPHVVRINRTRQLNADVVIVTSVRQYDHAYDTQDTDGKMYGHFTKHFIDCLERAQQSKKQMNFMEILTRVSQKLQHGVRKQDPQLSVTREDLFNDSVWIL